MCVVDRGRGPPSRSVASLHPAALSRHRVELRLRRGTGEGVVGDRCRAELSEAAAQPAVGIGRRVDRHQA
jgi:hypothetical protein